MKKFKKANYLVTGAWSEASVKDAEKLGTVHLVVPKSKTYSTVPDYDTWSIAEDADYFYFCENETVHGVEINDFPYHKIPTGMPLVCDMSSNFCTRPIDWSKFGVVYAGAQKNLGPAGATVLIVREDLIGWEMDFTPTVCSWKTYLKAPQTYHNTPATWPIYVIGLNLKYMKKKGLAKIQEEAEARAKLLYDTFESSGGYYSSPVTKKFRSRVNIPFRICKNEKLEKKFTAEATARGLIDLGGHRSVGGCRASCYNAMPIEGVRALTDFMLEFQR